MNDLNNNNEDDFFDIDDSSYPISDYKITTTPNDFNVMTIVSFIESGVFKIPSFQRNYVWDINRASKLIESLLIGLPIPQVFLYETNKNNFLVIDGQQRLMTIYYFMKGKFPKKSKRTQLRDIFDEHGKIPELIMHDSEYFQDFKLKLPSSVNGEKNRFNGLKLDTLEDIMSLNLATIRNMIIKPISNDEENNAMFEIFNRLNSGGMNLTSQEIRMSLYHSYFSQELINMNKNITWRSIIGKNAIDIRLNDIEVILRAFSLLCNRDEYKNTVSGFLNSFSEKSKKYTNERVKFLSELWDKFLDINNNFTIDSFKNNTGKFSAIIFESVFYVACKEALLTNDVNNVKVITNEYIEKLKEDEIFQQHSKGKTTKRENVLSRTNRAEELL